MRRVDSWFVPCPPQAHRVESGLRIFSVLSEHIAGNMASHFEMMCQIFRRCLCLKGEGGSVRLAALHALLSLLVVIDKSSERRLFQPLLPLMVELLGDLMGEGQVDKAAEALELLIELADSHPTWFRPALPSLVGALVAVANRREVADNLRQLCE